MHQQLNEDWGYNVNDENQYDFKNNDQFSVSFWFKMKTSVTPIENKQVMVGRWAGGGAYGNAGFNVQWNPATWKVEFRLRDISGTDTILVSSQDIGDNLWHHVVAAFYPDPVNDSWMHLYVDGVHTQLKYDFWLDDFGGTEDLYLGYNYNYLFPFTGLLDEVAIWKKELLAGDVAALRANGNAGIPLCQEGDVAPIITSTPVTTGTEDVDYSYTLTYRAMAGHTVTMSAPTKPAWASFNATTGVLSGRPLNAHSGANSVVLRMTEGSVSIDQTFSINVAAVNDPPAYTTTPGLTVITKSQYSYIINATDEEGQALTITCPTKPAWLAFSATAGNAVLIGTPQRTDAGNASVTLQVTDGTNTTPQSFTIVVTLDNHVPVITSTAPTSGKTDALYTYTITATDDDADALTYSAPTKPAFMNFNATTHVLSFVPSQANLGIHNVVLEVTDGKDVVQQPFTVTIVVNGVEDAVGSQAKVYPVPAHDFVVFEFAERLGNANLQMLSTTGELLKKIDISNLTSYTLDISDLAPSYYIYRIITDEGLQSGSIVVQ